MFISKKKIIIFNKKKIIIIFKIIPKHSLSCMLFIFLVSYDSYYNDTYVDVNKINVSSPDKVVFKDSI